jgi:hypothetical protein
LLKWKFSTVTLAILSVSLTGIVIWQGASK